MVITSFLVPVFSDFSEGWTHPVWMVAFRTRRGILRGQASSGCDLFFFPGVCDRIRRERGSEGLFFLKIYFVTSATSQEENGVERLLVLGLEQSSGLEINKWGEGIIKERAGHRLCYEFFVTS